MGYSDTGAHIGGYLLWFAVIRWGASNVQNLCLPMSRFNWLVPPPKKLKLWMLSQMQGSIFKHSVPSLWLTYIAKRRTTFAKAYGMKVRCYWEHTGNKRKNEPRNFLNNVPSRVLRKPVNCQHWFLPWSQCEGQFPLARSFWTFIIWKKQ